MIQDIKPGSQSLSPSLIILGQSVAYPEVVAKQTGTNRRNNRFSAPFAETLSYSWLAGVTSLSFLTNLQLLSNGD